MKEMFGNIQDNLDEMENAGNASLENQEMIQNMIKAIDLEKIKREKDKLLEK
jgi:hypothetical protein